MPWVGPPASNDLGSASDPVAGIRVAQGEAVYKPMKPGETYELRVEAVGGMTLVPVLATANAPSTDL